VSKAIDFDFKSSKVKDTESTFRNFGNSCHLANDNKKVITIYYENYVVNIKFQYIA